tara:strand:- start:57 stop:740 length:684 start_codon:yes stop_codon:yes gene_type:complete
MSVGYLIEIFGGTGAVILGIATCIWGVLKTHEFEWNYDLEIKKTPISILDETWDYGVGEEGNNHNSGKLAKKVNGNWIVNIKKGQGSESGVYIYTTISQPPEQYNKKKHFLRLNIENVKKNMDIKFEQKFFNADYRMTPGIKNHTKPIRKSGENIFEPECLIDLENHHETTVKKEQLGVYITTSEDEEIDNVIINGGYYGEKWNFCKLCCCRKNSRTLLYRRKAHDE